VDCRVRVTVGRRRAHPAFFPVGTGSPFPGGTAAEESSCLLKTCIYIYRHSFIFSSYFVFSVCWNTSSVDLPQTVPDDRRLVSRMPLLLNECTRIAREQILPTRRALIPFCNLTNVPVHGGKCLRLTGSCAICTWHKTQITTNRQMPNEVTYSTFWTTSVRSSSGAPSVEFVSDRPWRSIERFLAKRNS
jgi:hypothetical protein